MFSITKQRFSIAAQFSDPIHREVYKYIRVRLRSSSHALCSLHAGTWLMLLYAVLGCNAAIAYTVEYLWSIYSGSGFLRHSTLTA
jgi:hypothetical protein